MKKIVYALISIMSLSSCYITFTKVAVKNETDNTIKLEFDYGTLNKESDSVIVQPGKQEISKGDENKLGIPSVKTAIRVYVMSQGGSWHPNTKYNQKINLKDGLGNLYIVISGDGSEVTYHSKGDFKKQNIVR